jgi:hypothetical protein
VSLQDVNKALVAAGAAGDALVGMGQGALNVVKHPVDTVKGIGSGIGRFASRIGRTASRTVEKTKSDDQSSEGKSTTEKAADTTTGAAKEFVGVNAAYRNWCQKVKVDPYTTNDVLKKELMGVAKYDAAGSFSTKLLPLGVVGTVLGTTSAVNDLVWSKDPDELVTWIESKLKEMHVPEKASRDFRLNKNYSLTRQVRLVASLETLADASGRPEFVARAATASRELDAQFYQQSAFMAETYNHSEKISAIAPDLFGACAVHGPHLTCLYPLDYLMWTEGTANAAEKLTKAAHTHFASATKRIWLTGGASERARRELEARGWTVSEKRSDLLPLQVPPEETDPAAKASK